MPKQSIRRDDFPINTDEFIRFLRTQSRKWGSQAEFSRKTVSAGAEVGGRNISNWLTNPPDKIRRESAIAVNNYLLSMQFDGDAETTSKLLGLNKPELMPVDTSEIARRIDKVEERLTALERGLTSPSSPVNVYPLPLLSVRVQDILSAVARIDWRTESGQGRIREAGAEYPNIESLLRVIAGDRSAFRNERELPSPNDLESLASLLRELTNVPYTVLDVSGLATGRDIGRQSGRAAAG